jgi:nitrite reductase/ring-hydroxylating ferredoxin subunit
MPIWKVPGTSPPEPGRPTRVTIDGAPVAVFKVDNSFLAVSARCTHVGGPLDRGTVTGGVVTCPLHGSQFELASGRVIRGPATQPIKAYRARFEADTLVLETD